ncbi:MAG: hypothetical protein AB7O77_15325 [Phycisphaerales bacterium]
MEPLTVMMALILVLAAGAALWWIARRQGRNSAEDFSGNAGPSPGVARGQPPSPPAAVDDREVAIGTSSEEVGSASPEQEPECRTRVERQSHMAAEAPADSPTGYTPSNLPDGPRVQTARVSLGADASEVAVNGQSPGPSLEDSSTGDGVIDDPIAADVAVMRGEVKAIASVSSDGPGPGAVETFVGTDFTELVNGAKAEAFTTDRDVPPISPSTPSVPLPAAIKESVEGAAPAGVENEEVAGDAAKSDVLTADLVPADEAGSGVEGPALNVDFGPKQYKPPRRPGMPKLRREGPGSERTKSAPRDRSLLIDVRIRPERGGFCTVSLLARRTEDLPDIVTITTSGGLGELTALQDEWYLDVAPPGIGQSLRSGIVWESQDTPGSTTRWSLSGRDLYVLAPHERMSGHLAVARLELGEDHVVLCTRERLNEVQEAISATGSPEGTVLDWTGDETGTWVVLAGVRPERAVPLRGPADTLDALCPLPDARIALQGGIRLGRQAWLSGFPPAIRIVGDSSAIGVVHIDQHPAVRGADGAYEAPGWDRPGEHVVSCQAGTKSYQIASGLEKWEAWDAYTWSAGDLSTQEGVRPAICGMLVRPPQSGPRDGKHYSGPVANPVLLGAVPGQVYSCEGRSDLRSGVCSGYPPFEPVWALPADPLHCDKSIRRILKVGSQMPIPTDSARLSRRQKVQVRAWALAILDAARKGLRPEPDDDATASLWISFRREARAIWRSMR